MSKVGRVATPLIQEELAYQTKEYVMSVPINHQDMDYLIGRLMQMCDLIGDAEQRKALKDTIKQHCRNWLDEEYANHGYDKYEGAKEGVKTIPADMYKAEF